MDTVAVYRKSASENIAELFKMYACDSFAFQRPPTLGGVGWEISLLMITHSVPNTYQNFHSCYGLTKISSGRLYREGGELACE